MSGSQIINVLINVLTYLKGKINISDLTILHSVQCLILMNLESGFSNVSQNLRIRNFSTVYTMCTTHRKTLGVSKHVCKTCACFPIFLSYPGWLCHIPVVITQNNRL